MATMAVTTLETAVLTAERIFSAKNLPAAFVNAFCGRIKALRDGGGFGIGGSGRDCIGGFENGVQRKENRLGIDVHRGWTKIGNR
ncbi:hypothetical protein E2P81_ATG09967 [Venturia nashicola]|uniref:Uncharacterized protein n=1 Tax=Venturia nashicola TaxID=86259 RepID=A0A4Z1NR58_9PEZI|nr:hypothetical protein E6O75_ATG10188 [Venturia nashicola]TLD18669.1 hypothetical protein E2P81_ATG09967 [Venturia nashicola]